MRLCTVNLLVQEARITMRLCTVNLLLQEARMTMWLCKVNYVAVYSKSVGTGN